MAGFNIEVEEREGMAILRLFGDLFIKESSALEKETEDFLGKGARYIVINLGGIKYIGSSGIGVLVNLHRQLSEAGGRMILVEVPDKVTQVLTMMNLTMIEMMADEPAALDSIGSNP